MAKKQSKIVRMAALIWMLILVSFISLGAKAFVFKRVDIGKIPERYWIDDFMGCEI